MEGKKREEEWKDKNHDTKEQKAKEIELETQVSGGGSNKRRMRRRRRKVKEEGGTEER